MTIEEQMLATKAVNSPENAEKGSLLLFLDENVADRISTDSGCCTMDIPEIAAAMSSLGECSIRRVFPDVPGKIEKARAYGMHRWFEITFSETDDVKAVAQRFAPISDVCHIQFNTRLKKASDGISHPYNPSVVQTKAAGHGFNDPGLVDQWHYINNGDLGIAPTVKSGADINVAPAWELTTGDPSVIIAVLDEGVCYSHPDLQQNMWVNTAEATGIYGTDDDGNGYKDDLYGYNFVRGGAITWDASDDDSGHGTHVAGTIAAVNNNNTGVCGIAGGSGNNDGVKIMSCQIFVGKQGGTASIAAEAFVYAADNGASIAQCSWGYDAGSITSDAQFKAGASILYNAIRYFMDTRNNDAVDGGIVIFASGNDSKDMAGYPGAYRDYICVTSFASDNMPAYYTNYGPGSNIAAPGGEYYTGGTGYNEKSTVLSTLPASISSSGYGYMQGTSMACPHVSGVAALGISYMLKIGSQCTLDEFRAKLLTSVNDIEKYLEGSKQSKTTMNLYNYRNKMGTGTIDAWKFLMQIEGTPCIQVAVGAAKRISLADYFGGGSDNLTYIGVEMSDSDKERLGLDSEPEIRYGKLYIEPKRAGCARLVVRAIAGGTNLGDENTMGGMEVSKTVSVIARSTISSNGGWL
ncbi:MAG: S8 family serine peptidase [Clostridium sp.]|nr:S8 family serine peptidase [Bacteroides sp.]MCM1198407.1 S8 family serine peptidase [Clostridium sp.]